MKTLGSYITKFENKLIEAYNNNSFKESFSEFRKEVLKNDELKEAVNIYYELSSNKGWDKEFSQMFLNESINRLKEIYKRNGISKYLVEGDNNYQHIDEIVFSKNIEKKVINKLSILEGLQKKQEIHESILLPLSLQIDVANSKIKPLLENLSEEELSMIKEIKEMSDGQLSDLIDETKKEILDVFKKDTIEEQKMDQLTNKLNSYDNSHKSLFELRRFLNEIN